jgi:hypothetical protein
MKSSKSLVKCYVDAAGDLLTYDCAVRLRRANRRERLISEGERTGTGAFTAEVATRTVRTARAKAGV